MTESFQAVELKVAEAEFFLKHLEECGEPLHARFYFSAFSAAWRSISDALRHVMQDVDGFEAWFAYWLERLRQSPVATFLRDQRNASLHQGLVGVTAGMMLREGSGVPKMHHLFGYGTDLPDGVPENAAATSKEGFILALQMLRDLHQEFGHMIDPQLYYTADNFSERGLTIEDAEEEICGLRGWTSGIPAAERWEAVRRAVRGGNVQRFFAHYLEPL